MKSAVELFIFHLLHNESFVATCQSMLSIVLNNCETAEKQSNLNHMVMVSHLYGL